MQASWSPKDGEKKVKNRWVVLSWIQSL